MPVPKGSTKARVPTQLKVVRGTLEGGRTNNKREPQRDVHGIPDPPAYLTPGEAAAYEKFAKSIDKMRISTKDDFAALELLACTYHEMQKLRQALRNEDPEDLTYETFNKYGAVRRMRPEVVALGDVDRRLLGLLGRFGLTPADRGRVNDLAIGEDGKPLKDDEEEFTS